MLAGIIQALRVENDAAVLREDQNVDQLIALVGGGGRLENVRGVVTPIFRERSVERTRAATEKTECSERGEGLVWNVGISVMI